MLVQLRKKLQFLKGTIFFYVKFYDHHNSSVLSFGLGNTLGECLLIILD